MDLSLHGEVLWRYRYILVFGALLAVALAVLSVARPTLDGGAPALEYRESELWQTKATLLLTRPGFPEGRLTFTTDPSRLSGLADLYSKLAFSDAVLERLRRQGSIDGTFFARPVISETSGPTPLIWITGQAATPAETIALTRRVTSAFLSYVVERQQAAAIPPADRVDIQVVREAEPPTLTRPRKNTLPIVVLLAVLSASVGLVYVLEANRKPRETIRAVEASSPELERDEPRPVPEPEPLTARRWA